MTQWGLDTLFNPAKRHMDEEKRRLQSTREEVGDSSDGKRIDLESGRVTVRRVPSPEGFDAAERPADETGAARRARLRRRRAEPVVSEPVVSEPVVCEPVVSEPVVCEPAAESEPDSASAD